MLHSHFQVCRDQTDNNGFTPGDNADNAKAATNSLCTEDYVGIQG